MAKANKHDQRPITFRRWLMCQLVLGGANVFMALDAIATTALEHPEWDMDQVKTWDEWEREGRG